MPRIHYRGNNFEYRVIYPTGEAETVLRVPKYDFNWQLFYYYIKPVVLPAGRRIECTAHFDNSANNPYNPDPKSEVRWGDQTWEEMMIGWFDIAVDAGKTLVTCSKRRKKNRRPRARDHNRAASRSTPSRNVSRCVSRLSTRKA